MSNAHGPYDRVSVIVGVILVGIVLLLVVDVPPRVFQFRPLGTPLTFNVTAVWAMSILLEQGGLKHGGLNFDAKVRRGSFDLNDLFIAHIGGMDTFARALLIAQAMKKDGKIAAARKARYAGLILF